MKILAFRSNITFDLTKKKVSRKAWRSSSPPDSWRGSSVRGEGLVSEALCSRAAAINNGFSECVHTTARTPTVSRARGTSLRGWSLRALCPFTHFALVKPCFLAFSYRRNFAPPLSLYIYIQRSSGFYPTFTRRSSYIPASIRRPARAPLPPVSKRAAEGYAPDCLYQLNNHPSTLRSSSFPISSFPFCLNPGRCSFLHPLPLPPSLRPQYFFPFFVLFSIFI